MDITDTPMADVTISAVVTPGASTPVLGQVMPLITDPSSKNKKKKRKGKP